jgi:vanillate O-demethylase monooxygenase subunit
MLAVAADAALSHFRWTFDKLVAAERAEDATAKAAAPITVHKAPHQAGAAT